MLNYIGIIQKEKNSFGIIFPDFPGCISVGKTTEEVYRNGIEVLSLHLDGMKEDKEKIPAPRTLEEIKQAKEEWFTLDNSIVMYIPYITNQEKSIRINITMNQNLVNKIDNISKNRSAFLSQAVENYLKFI